MSQKNVTLVGAGLVGSLLSIYLSKRGYKVTIYERRGDMRKEEVVAGRSINLALSDRGWQAINQVGLGDEIRKVAIPMKGRFIHNVDGTTALFPYGKEGQAIYSVSRGGLNMKLMDLAEQNYGVKINFKERCTHVDLKTNKIFLEHTETKKLTEETYDLIFSSDGAFSAGRLSAQLSTDRFEYNQHYIDCGYKELVIPANADGSFKTEKNALHIWPRGKYMMIALPNIDGSFTCTLFFPFEGEPSFASLKTEEQVEKFFKEKFCDAMPMMPTLVHDYIHNPTSSLVTVKCYPWTFENKLGLIGDAAHAIVPFFGQGMNCGFEDVFVLDKLIDKHNENWPAIFEEYQVMRKPDGDAIADLAIGNFIEMRDTVADPMFQLRKKIEAKIHTKHPEKWIPAYSMVTFSPQIRYSEAMKKGKEQDAIMDIIMALPNIEKIWDSQEVEDKILAKVK